MEGQWQVTAQSLDETKRFLSCGVCLIFDLCSSAHSIPTICVSHLLPPPSSYTYLVGTPAPESVGSPIRDSSRSRSAFSFHGSRSDPEHMQVTSEPELTLVDQLDPATWTGPGCRDFRQSLVASIRSSPCLGTSRTQRCRMWSPSFLCAARAMNGLQTLPLCNELFSLRWKSSPASCHREKGRGEDRRRELLFPA